MSTRPSRRRAGLLVGVLLLVPAAVGGGAARADVTPSPSVEASPPATVSASPGSALPAPTTAPTTAATTTSTPSAAVPSSAAPTGVPSTPGVTAATPSTVVVPFPSTTSVTAPTGAVPVTDPTRQFLATATPIATSTDGLPILGTLVFGPTANRKSDVPQSATIKDGLTCPDTTTAYTTFLVGPDASWQAVQIVVGSRTSFTKDDVILVNFLNSLNGVAAENNLKLIKGRYDVNLVCFSSIVTRIAMFTGSFWVVDDLGTKDYVDWSPTDPSTTTLPSSFSSLVTEPVNKIVEGGKVVLRANLNPASVVGNVQFSSTTSDGVTATLGNPVAVTSGSVGLEVSGLTFGLYSMSAVFTPTDAARFTTATSDDVPFAVVKSVPPVPPTSVAISGTPKVGSAVTCAITGAFQNATSTGWEWYRDFTLLEGQTTNSYTPETNDGKHLLRCRATGTNTGGTSGRLSPGVLVSS